MAAMAYGEQGIGDTAVAATGDGSDVPLRENAGFEFAVLSSVSSQTTISILDGPASAADGSLWYYVAAGDQTGWVEASFVVSAPAEEAPVEEEVPAEDVPAEEEVPAEDVPAEEDVPVEDVPAEDPVTEEVTEDLAEEAPAYEVIPWQDPIDYGVVVVNVNDGSFPEIGIACRPAADENATELARLNLGDSVEIVGEAFWQGDIEWYPVNCGGAGAFVKADYVSIPSGEEVEVIPTEVVTEEVATEEEVVPTEDVTEDVVTEEAAEEVATEGDVEVVPTEEVATEDVVTEEATEEVATEEDLEFIPTEEVATEEVAEEATAEAPAEEATEEATPKLSFYDTIDADVIGSAEVEGTNGDGLVCRTEPDSSAPIITVLAEGASVQVTETTSTGYLQVVCASQIGYASTSFLWSGGLTDDDADFAAAVDETAETNFSAAASSAKVTGTGGTGVRCRVSPNTSARVITVLSEGTSVSVTGNMQNGWVPVTCGGQSGWVYGSYLTSTGSGTPAPGGGSGATGSAKVTGTNGDGVRCRTSGSTSGSIITVLAEGTTVSTRGAASNGWTPVVCGGQSGFVSSQYLTTSGGGGSTPTPTPAPGGGATGSAKVTGTNGDGVRCRTSGSTSGSIITVLAEGTTVSTRGAASNGWTPVVCGGQNGFVSSQYLTVSGGGGSTPTPTPAPGNGGGLAVNDHAKVTSTLNLRYDASMSAGIATTAPGGTVVKIVGGPTNGFYKVDWDGLGGWMHGDYLTKTSDALSERGGSGNAPEPTPDPGNGGGTGSGNAMVDFAMGYLGYPYVWATHGPASFDCSGFTYWVAKNVLGIDIGTGLWTQATAGTPVSKANLQPGDIVLFQNTYKAGLSHVGIYIGNGQFIHAENETTGVRISDLNSSYYGSRWYGAVRLG
jgi:uncharacterized protein YgiM (DUF1202 family)